MSPLTAFFTYLMLAAAAAVAGLIFATVIIVTDPGPTNYQTTSILAWCALGILVLGILFGLAAFGIDEK